MRWGENWDGYGPEWLSLLFMGMMMLVFWGGIVWAIVALTRRSGSPNPAPGPGHPPTSAFGPEELLHDRLARGDISVDDYNERMEALRSRQSAPITEPPASP